MTETPRTLDAAPTDPLPSDLPAPTVVELPITRLQAQRFRAYEDAIARSHAELNAFALGVLAGHDVESAQQARLGGTAGAPTLRYLAVPPGVIIGQAAF